MRPSGRSSTSSPMVSWQRVLWLAAPFLLGTSRVRVEEFELGFSCVAPDLAAPTPLGRSAGATQRTGLKARFDRSLAGRSVAEARRCTSPAAMAEHRFAKSLAIGCAMVVV
eukprot:3283094-Pleurochrysis_carterae.AAC.5